jgi:hypothetical protein
MDLSQAKEFVTPGGLLTVGGASFAVWLLSNTIRVASGRDLKLIPLFCALLVGFLLAYFTHALTDGMSYFIALLNSCLLFLTANGFHGVASEAGTPKDQRKGKLHGRGNVKFLTPWFK